MARGPVRALAIDEAAAAHELEDVVAGFDDLALEGLAAADQVAHALVGLGGHLDEDETVVSEVTADLDGVTSVGFAALARALWDERRCRQFAGHTPLREGALERRSLRRS